MHTISRIRTIASAGALALVLAGCADEQADTADAEAEQPDEPADEPDADTTDTTDEPDADEPDASDPAGDPEVGADGVATDTVEARNLAFEPADIEVEVGTTVTWANEDSVDHTVTSGPVGDPDGVFDEPLASGADDVAVTFDESGTFDYYCDIHRSMVGSVTVPG